MVKNQQIKEALEFAQFVLGTIAQGKPDFSASLQVRS
jgi:hypothetical protein